jgi:hypothetical protein
MQKYNIPPTILKSVISALTLRHVRWHVESYNQIQDLFPALQLLSPPHNIFVIARLPYVSFSEPVFKECEREKLPLLSQHLPSSLNYLQSVRCSTDTKSLLSSVLNTNSTEHNHSVEDNVLSARQEITRSLCNPKFHYPLHNCRPLASVQSYISRLGAFAGRFVTYINVILQSVFSSSK